MAYIQNNPLSRKTSSPFNKVRASKPGVINNMKAISRRSSSPLNTHHNVEPRTGEWIIDPNDPKVRSRTITTPASEEYVGETLEAGSEEEKKWADQKAWCDTQPPGTPGCGGFHKFEGGVDTEYQDRNLIEEKKKEDYYQVNQKNMMMDDQKYDWKGLYKNWSHKAKLYEPRSGEDYGGDIDFDFGVDHRTAEQGGNIEGKHVKDFYGNWNYISSGRLPYIDATGSKTSDRHLSSDQNRQRWAHNMGRSYNANLRNYADEYVNNLNINNLGMRMLGLDVPIGDDRMTRRNMLTQDQHNDIYYGAHNKWFKNFKKAYPEIKWRNRDRKYGEGSNSSHYSDWENRS
jgi:hypothetical protein